MRHKKPHLDAQGSLLCPHKNPHLAHKKPHHGHKEPHLGPRKPLIFKKKAWSELLACFPCLLVGAAKRSLQRDGANTASAVHRLGHGRARRHLGNDRETVGDESAARWGFLCQPPGEYSLQWSPRPDAGFRCTNFPTLGSNSREWCYVIEHQRRLALCTAVCAQQKVGFFVRCAVCGVRCAVCGP